MDTWALFDSSWLGHRARLTMKGLDHRGQPTEIIFGFFCQLLHTCRDPNVATNRVAVFFDSRQSLREAAYPPYKGERRNRTEEEWRSIDRMQDQLKRLRKEILPDCGFPCYHQRGLESDDLMAQAVLQLAGRRTVMITADEDLLQCLSTPGSVWYDPSRSKMFDAGTMQHEKRVGPNDWARVKATAGCTSDNVAGIKGVGEKTAIDDIWNALPTHLKKYAAIHSPEGEAIIARNLPLVTLPHPATQPLALPEGTTYRPERFAWWFDHLGFASFHGGARADWQSFFSGHLGNITKQVDAVRYRG